MKEIDITTNSKVWKLIHHEKICLDTGKCPRCPIHGGGDNKLDRERPSRYKNKSRTTIRKGKYD